MKKFESDNDRLSELLDTAKSYFHEAENGWRTVRQTALDDLRFYRGVQWDAQLLRVAKVKQEPTLTVNRLPNFVKQVENELRQRELNVSVHALDEAGSDDVANVFSGIIRAIEQDSHAKSHYIHAAGENGALVPGFGYIKIEVEDVTSGRSKLRPEDFLQKIKITSVKDPMKILADPTSMEPDFSDSNYWFEFEDYSEKEFKRLFPRAQHSSAEMFPIGAAQSKWIGENGIRVARFWYKEESVVIHYLLKDGSVISSRELQGPEHEDSDSDDYLNADGSTIRTLSEDEEQVIDPVKGEIPVLRRREVVECKIKWCDFSGAEILNEGEWAGDYFPFAAVTGPITINDGVRDIRGIIRYAKDSQKMLNYMASSTARRIASANKAPWIVEASSIKNYKRFWDTANTENWSYLPYDALDANGNLRNIPPPTRADQTGQIQDLLAAAQKFEDDLKATIGIYDAGLGATPNEQSGVAIKTLAQQGQNANYHFSDNLVRSIQHVGRILVNLIPKIYDTPRVVRMVDADGKVSNVAINQIFEKNGEATAYYLTEGDYGVTIDVGPAYANSKQAAVEQMLEMARVNPNILPFIQDIIAGNMDFNGKKVVQDRLQKLLARTAPEMLEGTPQADVPPQALAAMQQQSVVIKQLSDELMALQQEYQKTKSLLDNKIIEHQQDMELEDLRFRNQMLLQKNKSDGDAVMESLKAIREDQNNLREKELTEIKTHLSHTEKMIELTMTALEKFGPDAIPTINHLAENGQTPQQD